MKRFKGTGVAIVTPFKNDSSIDFAAFGRVIDHVRRIETAGIVIF